MACWHLPILPHPPPPTKSSQGSGLSSDVTLVKPIKSKLPQCYFETHYPILFVFSRRIYHYVKMSHLFTYVLSVTRLSC